MLVSDLIEVLQALAEAAHRPADHPLEDLLAMIGRLDPRPVEPLSSIAEVVELNG